MKANELRIGNWVKCKCPDFEEDDVQLENIHPKGTVIDDYPYSISELQPIPLTEEWVDKLSESEFEFAGFGTRIIYQSIKFPALKYEFTNNKIAVYVNDEMINIVSYVHDWQNIHHALTREELTITQ